MFQAIREQPTGLLAIPKPELSACRRAPVRSSQGRYLYEPMRRLFCTSDTPGACHAALPISFSFISVVDFSVEDLLQA
jgi:hypothetical protein